MRILMISNMFPTSERPFSGIYVRNLFQRLSPQAAVDLMVIESRYRSGTGKIFAYLRFFWRFFRALFRRYDIVHLHFFYPLILCAAPYRVCHPHSRLIITFHGSDVLKHGNNALTRIGWSILLRCSDVNIAVGRALGQVAEEKFGIHIACTLSAGVDPAVFYPDPHSEKEFDFLFVGSFDKTKGLDVLLSAIDLLDGPSRSFCFVGQGPLGEQILQHGARHRLFVKEPCKQDDLRRAYASSRFLIVPSRSEGFGLVVSEAMYCGTPVIGTLVGGIPEQIRHDENGFLVPP